MATLVFQAYYGAGPTWTTLQNVGELVGFYGAAYNDKVAVDSYQSSTHISGASGDVCLTNHTPNVKYVSSTQFIGTGGTETLNDTNLTANECTLRAYLNDGSAVATQNGRFYVYDGSGNPAIYASDIQAWAFEQGVTATTWTDVNNGTSTGGDNNGERLNLGNSSSATDHYFYIAVSVSPKTVGAKTAFALGVTLEYY